MPAGLQGPLCGGTSTAPWGWVGGARSGGGSLWSLRIWPLPARGGGKVETIKAEGRDMPDSELLPAGKPSAQSECLGVGVYPTVCV